MFDCPPLDEQFRMAAMIGRDEAAEALGRIGLKSACGLDALRKATHDSDPYVQYVAVKALGQIGPLALPAAPDLMDAAFAGGAVATEALESLSRLGPCVIPFMLPWLEIVKDEYGEDTKHSFAGAAAVLTKIGKPAIPALIETLKVPARRKGAADALGDMGEIAAEAVVPLMEAYAADSDRYVRYSIVDAFGNIGPPAKAALPLLAEILGSKDASDLMKRTAKGSLAKIRGDNAPQRP